MLIIFFRRLLEIRRSTWWWKSRLLITQVRSSSKSTLSILFWEERLDSVRLLKGLALIFRGILVWKQPTERQPNSICCFWLVLGSTWRRFTREWSSLKIHLTDCTEWTNILSSTRHLRCSMSSNVSQRSSPKPLHSVNSSAAQRPFHPQRHQAFKLHDGHWNRQAQRPSNWFWFVKAIQGPFWEPYANGQEKLEHWYNG